MLYLFIINKIMRSLPKEPLFNSKELNKILPSYLLDEIDKEEKKVLNNRKDIQKYDVIDSKKSNKVRNIF